MGILTLAALLLSPQAHAVDHELNLDYGWQGARDEDWELISDNPRIGMWGVNGGLAVSERLSVVAGYQRGRRGSRLYFEDDGINEDEGMIQTLFSANQFNLGVKADLDVNPWVRPYATLQGVAMLGTLRMDDNEDADDNLNQLTYRGLGPGGLVALGGEFFGSPPEAKVRACGYLEVGYSHVFPMKFESESGNATAAIGDLDFNGVMVRTGVGMRF